VFRLRVGGEADRPALDGAPERVHELVTADVRRAAWVIENGLGSFAARG
jgi:hypothetical protein